MTHIERKDTIYYIRSLDCNLLPFSSWQTTSGMVEKPTTKPVFEPLPIGEFCVILIDPPWQYKDKVGKRGAHSRFPTVDTETLKTLPVASIAAENCAMFMWVTPPMLPDAFELIKAWGFQYKTIAFHWVKTIKSGDNEGKPRMGTGNWTRANPEICLLATKGKPKRVDTKEARSVNSVVMAPLGEFAEKPAEVHERIVTLMGDLPRIELFARQVVPGWVGWGDEYPL